VKSDGPSFVVAGAAAAGACDRREMQSWAELVVAAGPHERVDRLPPCFHVRGELEALGEQRLQHRPHRLP